VRVFSAGTLRTSVQELARYIAYLPQHPAALLFNDTLRAELEFTLRCRDQRGDVAGMLDVFGLAELAQRSPFDLSGGQRQRAALAAVLVGSPPVALLDEPTRGMDAGQRAALVSTLRRLATIGTTVVVATHDAELAAGAADQVVFLEAGRVTAQGPTCELLPRHPIFAPLVSRIFGPQYLTVDDVLATPAPVRQAG
jgi:energy-coupling factor transport system ATP-binding protein